MNLHRQHPPSGGIGDQHQHLGPRLQPFGFYDATVDGGWEVPGEPFTNAPGTDFRWWRSRMMGGRTNHWGRISLRQGRYDIVCPMRSAWELHLAWPEADLRIVPDAGHSAFEPGDTSELIKATDRFAGPGTAARKAAVRKAPERNRDTKKAKRPARKRRRR